MSNFGRWAVLFLLMPVWAFGAAETQGPLQKTLGPPTEMRNGVRIYLFPRTDLNLLVAGTPLEPGMGLETRFEFQPAGKSLRLKGQLLLMDVEIPKILDLLSRRHWKVEGLTHGLLGESPAVKFLQFRALGTSYELADGVRALLSALGQTLPVATPALVLPETPDENFQKQADSLLAGGQWKGRALCLALESSSNTLNAAQENEPPFSGVLYLQKTTEGALARGDLILPPEQAETFFQTLSDNHLLLTSWIRETGPDGSDGTRLRFLGKGSLEEMARGLNALRDQWNSLHPQTETSQAKGEEAPRLVPALKP